MNRTKFLETLRVTKEPWDVVVVGGGATGLGVAVDAAARGLRTVLLEQNDFAKGTSSRSTKIAHGGVRYLQQGDIPLVYEALHERGLMIQNAPHLVRPLTYVVPTFSLWESFFYGVGLKVYDALSGFTSLGRSKILGRAKALEYLPTIRRNVSGGVLYMDGQFDDARLALTLALTVSDLGGVPLNYMRVTALTKSGGRVSGVVAREVGYRGRKRRRGRGRMGVLGGLGARCRGGRKRTGEPPVQIWTAMCAYLLVAIAHRQLALPENLHRTL